MQFRVKGKDKWLFVSGSVNRSTLYFNANINLLEYILNGLNKHFINGDRMWLVFSRDEERILDKIAAEFLPCTEDRSAIFLNGILNQLRQMRKEEAFATYVTTNPGVSLTDAKPSQLRLAIEFKK
jgi:hypothetical protein